jgi:hypothetical protein
MPDDSMLPFGFIHHLRIGRRDGSTCVDSPKMLAQAVLTSRGLPQAASAVAALNGPKVERGTRCDFDRPHDDVMNSGPTFMICGCKRKESEWSAADHSFVLVRR